jgi:hypothetical protein
MSSFHHPRLINESVLLGTELILHQQPAAYSRELEQAIQDGIRQAVLHYAEGLATRERQLHPLQHRTPYVSTSP